MTNTVKRIMFFNKFAAFTSLANALGINFMITCFYRSPEEQKKRYDEGASKCNGTTKKSYHQKWLAIDVVIVRSGVLEWSRIPEYDTLGKIWEMLGGVWGGDWEDFEDVFHFQYGG